MAEKLLTKDELKAENALPSKLYKSLFSFKREEVKKALASAKVVSTILGLRLLQVVSPSKEASATNIKNSILLSGACHGKLLIVTPRRSGKACQRNRLRRQIKAIYYEEKLYQRPVASILFVYKQANDLSFEQIKSFLEAHLAKAHLAKAHLAKAHLAEAHPATENKS